jgi:hypothetical protein
MAMTETAVPVCFNEEMTPNPNPKPNTDPQINPTKFVKVKVKVKSVIKHTQINTPIDTPIPIDTRTNTPIPIDTQTNTHKKKPTFKPKKNIQLASLKVAPKPESMGLESDAESDSESESEEKDLYYERWINGEQLLVSTDNKRIYDPETYEHIGNMLDESIDWCIV